MAARVVPPSTFPRTIAERGTGATSTDNRKPSLRSRSEEHTSELQSHSDLHSFPTRRSSDLAQTRPGKRLVQPVRMIRVSGELRRVGQIPERSVLEWRPEWSHPALFRGQSPNVAPARPAPITESLRCDLDRKSTRLNSSHTVIYTLSLHDALPI